jgi:RNA-binding protein YlmH
MLYLEDELEFVAKAKEYLKQAEKNQKVILTKFLSLREQEILNDLFRYSEINLVFSGGYEQAERKRCLIIDPVIPISDNLFEIICYKIDYNKRYLNLTHSNILGTLMSLKLDRSLFGDIVMAENCAYFFTTKEIESIIQNEFKVINHTPIQLTIMDDSIEIENKYETREVIVSSLRIDHLISVVFKLSRSDAQQLISQNAVNRNFQIVNQKSAVGKKEDIISVRRYGRFIIGDELRQTKSNRIVLAVKIPVR